jgi:hypothetical protein
MSDEPILRVRSRTSSGSGRALRVPILGLAAGIWVLALSEVSQSWDMVRLASSYEVPARIGDLVSATLLNGQVFFGTLDSASRTTIRLSDVFFAQLPPQGTRAQEQEAEPRTPSIVRRKDNEWTQADVMAIPVERIAFMETVGIDSRMARFIAAARSQPPLLPSGQPSSQLPGSPERQPSAPAATPQSPAPGSPPPPPKE